MELASTSCSSRSTRSLGLKENRCDQSRTSCSCGEPAAPAAAVGEQMRLPTWVCAYYSWLGPFLDIYHRSATRHAVVTSTPP